MIGEIRKLLILPHIKVQNANALSSPFTIGFPAMTAWLGAVHALQRKINIDLPEVNFKSTAVISHRCDLQTYKGDEDFEFWILGTANPLNKDGKRPAFITEARCHLDVSLIVEYIGINKNEEEQFLKLISGNLNSSVKIAGGDVLFFSKLKLFRFDDGDEKMLRKITRLVMPGYAIQERRELMVEAMKDKNGEDEKDAIGALLDYLSMHYHCEKDENGNVNWTGNRKIPGWIVPIATGFHGITSLGKAKNQRDLSVPHRFAESVVTLGEFIMPHKINSIDEILWNYHVDAENNLYLCQQVGI